MFFRAMAWALLGAMAAVGGCSSLTPRDLFRAFEAPTVQDRPDHWAELVAVADMVDVYRVSPHVYRGPQPTPQQAKELREMGIRSIVTLRTRTFDPEIEAVGLIYHHIPMRAWLVHDEEVADFLRLATDEEHTPIYVHCMTGGDRTGLAIAAYRVAVQGWTRQQALDEMTFGGYGYHPIWQALAEYVAEFDVRHVRLLARLCDERIAGHRTPRPADQDPPPLALGGGDDEHVP